MSTEEQHDLDIDGMGFAVGLVGVGFCLLVVFGLYFLVQTQVAEPIVDERGFWLYQMGCAGLLSLLIGLYLRQKAWLLAALTYQARRATPMPMLLVNDHDDVWVTGRIESDQPIAPPSAPEVECVWWREREERYEQNTQKWIPGGERSRCGQAWLCDGEHRLELDLRLADLDDMPSTTRTWPDRRNTISYLPLGTTVGACGLALSRAEYRQLRLEEGRREIAAAGGQPLMMPPKMEARARRLTARRARKVERAQARQAKKQGLDRLQPVLEGFDLVGDDRGAEPLPRQSRPLPGKDLIVTSYGGLRLLLTTLAREAWKTRALRQVVHAREAALVTLWFGLAALFWTFAVASGHTVWWAMEPMFIAAIVAGTLLVPLATIDLFNRFVTERARVAQAWAHIDVDLQLRHDLIPNLVEVCKAIASHERQTYEQVAAMRNARGTQADATSLVNHEAELTRLTDHLLAVVEAYPQLAANDNYVNLHRQLTAIEEKIAHGRTVYNAVVRDYNELVATMPNMLLASPCGFPAMPYWQMVDAAAAAPPRL